MTLDPRDDYIRDLSRAFNRRIRNDVAQLARRLMREDRFSRKTALLVAEVVVLDALNSITRANFEGRRR